MRKSVLFFSFLISSSAFALYNGSPTLPEMPENSLSLPEDCGFSMKMTYEGDLVLGRKITATSLSDPNVRSFLNGAEVAFGFMDRVELYTLLGGFNSTVSGYQGSSYCKVKIKESFGGLIGARAIGIFWGDLKVGFDAKYFYGWPNLESLQKGSDKASATASGFQREWQIGVAIAQRFAVFTPYIGANYSRFVLDLNKISSDFFPSNINVQNTSPFGFLIGLGICGEKGPFFDFEARFFDEYALSAALGLRF